MKMQPWVRAILIGLATVVAALTAIQDQLPEYVQALLAGISVALAGVGIIPPQVPTRTVVDPRREDGYGLVELVIAVLVILVLIFLLFRLV